MSKKKKEKPGTLLYHQEWKTAMNFCTDEQLGQLLRCAFLLDESRDNPSVFPALEEMVSTFVERQKVCWEYIVPSLNRSFIQYREKIVRTAWGGYKTSHNISSEEKVGSRLFLEWYANSEQFSETLFQNESWYESAIASHSMLTETEAETFSINQSVDGEVTGTEKEAGVSKGERERKNPDSSYPFKALSGDILLDAQKKKAQLEQKKQNNGRS